MRRPRPTFAAAPLALIVAALLAMLPAAPPARAEDGPRLRRVTAAAAGPVGPAQTTAPGPSSAPAAAAPGGAARPPATHGGDIPYLALPRSPGADGVPAAGRTSSGAFATGGAAGMAPGDAARVRLGPAGAAPQALSDACLPLLANGSVAAAYDEGDGSYYLYDWFFNGQNVAVTTDAYVSFPYALAFSDGDERDSPGSVDYDGFGQAFTLPAEAASFRFDFQTAVVAGTRDAGDRTALELYLVNPDGSLADANPGTAAVDPVAALGLDQFQLDDGSWGSARGTLSDPAALAALRGRRVAAVFSQYGNKQGRGETALFDNLQAAACPTAEPSTQSVYGYVTVGGRPTDPNDSRQFDQRLTTATVALAYSPDGGQRFEVARVTNAGRNGYFEFRDVPPLRPGALYQAWYLNSGGEELPGGGGEGRLSYATAGPVTSFRAFQGLPGTWGYAGIVDITDVALLEPQPDAEVPAAASFAWTPRGFTTAEPPGGPYRYLVCFYNPDRVLNGRYEEVCTTAPVAEAQITIDSAIFERDVPGFLRLGASYGWYVRVLGPGYQASPPAYLGASRTSRFVTFTDQPERPAPAPARENDPPPAGARKPWTLLFYIAADDPELTFPAGRARGMGQVVAGLSDLARRFPDVNVAVQFDLFESDLRPLPSQALRGTRRCAFGPAAGDLDAACQTLGELSMGDPQTLTDFLNAGLERYPGERTALIVVGHGSPVAGVAGDRTTPTGEDDALRPDELAQALGLARLDAPERKLDLIFFHTSLMGNYETAAIVAPFADYMVASPNIAQLIDLSRDLLALASEPGLQPWAFAQGLVSAYRAELAATNSLGGSNLSLAMAAYDLAQIAALTPQVDALAEALRANLGRDEVRAARLAVQQYDSSAPVLWGFTADREDALVDLRHLAALLVSSPEPAVRRAAGALAAPDGPLAAAVIASAAASGAADYAAGGSHDLGNAFGMSIFFPNGGELGQQPALADAYLDTLGRTSLAAGRWTALVAATGLARGLPGGVTGRAGDLGSTLQTFAAPRVFPAAATIPPGGPERVWLPLARR
jgi:hypothetical protein